jgi:hypothetical protein
MQLLNLAIGFALLGFLGLYGLFFTASPAVGLYIIVLSMVGTFVCIYTHEQSQKNNLR